MKLFVVASMLSAFALFLLLCGNTGAEPPLRVRVGKARGRDAIMKAILPVLDKATGLTPEEQKAVEEYKEMLVISDARRKLVEERFPHRFGGKRAKAPATPGGAQ